jgi:transcriptional regulator with XRE-family HTH domain
MKFDGNMNVIGRLLKEYRKNKNLSYEQLSAKLELMGISIHKQSLYDIENNKRTVKDYELFGIAYVLGIYITDLLKDISNKF